MKKVTHDWIACGVATDQDGKLWAIFFDQNLEIYSMEPVSEI
jgi:hypothetical protein